eukprot:Colp12_sorted_trinity150504_noHs@29108
MPSVAETPASSGMLQDVAMSMFKPGVPPGVIKFLNIIFAGLFTSLIFLMAVWGLNIHVIVMFSLALGLFFSTQWFLSECGKMLLAQQEEDKPVDAKDNEDKKAK